MTSQTSASKILSAIAKKEWKEMGQNSETPPVTPDGIRQWMPDFTESEEDSNYARLHNIELRQRPKEPEPDQWWMKMWYRVTRCWLQHAIDVPAQGYNLELTLDSSGAETSRVKKPLCIPTKLQSHIGDKNEVSIINNPEEIEPRSVVHIATIAILSRWNNELNLTHLKDVYRISSLEDGIVAIHKLWAAVDKKHKKAFYHPIAAMVQAYLQETTATHCSAEHNRKYPVAVLKHPMANVRELAFTENEVGEVFKTPARVDQIQQMELELRCDCDASVLPGIMPLQVVRTAGLKPQTRSGAVSHELRIFFEAMMALQPNQHRADLMFRLGDLINYLYPNGKFNWTNQIPHIKRAFSVLHTHATVPWIDDQGSLREWRPVAVRAPLIDDATRETPIYIEVQMPPDARRGHMVIKGVHRHIGMKSAAQWNAYHIAAYLWDKHGTVNGKLVDPTRPSERRDNQNRLVDATGKPLLNRNGKEIKSPYHPEAVRQLEREPNTDAIQRYPVLPSEDLILACFPNGYNKKARRVYLKRAKAHWQQLEADGYIVIHKERHGWRILPSAEHLKAHRALRKAAKGIY